jgi:hypothetical protein
MPSEIIFPREALPLLFRELARPNRTIESLKILGRFRMPLSDVAVAIFAELEASAGTIEDGAAEWASMYFDMAAKVFGVLLELYARKGSLGIGEGILQIAEP